ncbi:hypothetical protein BC828DRAFT_386970 [Blastocladiella britannica]|nr:hypothetical protein BC828DRAFT_386970 [Blastocladiella britannica]
MSRHAQPATSAANKRHTFQGTMGAPSTTSSSSGSGRFRIGDLFSRIRNATTSSSRRDTNASFERSATLAVLPSLASDFPSRAPTAAAASPPPPPPKVTNGTGSTTPHSRFSTLAGGGDQVMVRTNAAPAPTVSRHATADAATFSFLAADPHATPAPQAHHQRSKSVGGSSIVASIRERARSLTRGGSAMSETVYERTDVPPVPMLPEFLPAGEEGSAATTGYVSVYAHRDDADAARGRKRTKSTTTTGGSKPRGRSLTDVLMGRPKPVAEVPPPLPTSFFRTMQPRTVTEAEARGFLAEALTTRMPEVALFEARKVLDGLGAVVVGHGTDPVRGIPGHGDGAFVLKCRLKLGKKTGVTDTRLKAELDALELLERDEAFSPVSLPSVAAAEAVSSAAPRDVPEDTAAISAAEAEKHRRRKSSGTTASAAGGSNPLDHLSVYSGYSSGAASSGPVVLPSDYPALYSQPDVAAAIAAGSGRPGTTPKLAPGQLSASSSNSPQTYETAMLSSSTSAAAAANATYAHAQPVSVHYSSYYSSTPTMSHNARAISEGVHIAQVAKVDASASLSGKVLKNLRAFGSDLLFTVEIVAVPGHKATWAIVFHRTKGSTVSYGRVKHIVLRKLYRSDEKMRQLLG